MGEGVKIGFVYSFDLNESIPRENLVLGACTVSCKIF